MALGIYFVHMGFTPEKYDEAIKKLEAAGAGSPKGRLNHFALESDGKIQSSTCGSPKRTSMPLDRPSSRSCPDWVSNWPSPRSPRCTTR